MTEQNKTEVNTEVHKAELNKAQHATGTQEPPATTKPSDQPSTGSSGTGGNNAGGNHKSKSSTRIALYGLFVAAAVASEEILEHWGVFSTRDFVRTQFGLGPVPEPPTAAIRHPPLHDPHIGVSTNRDPIPAVSVDIATDPVLVNPTNQSSLPVEIVPMNSDIPTEVSDIIPLEIIEIVQQDPAELTQDKPLYSPPTSAEQVLTELFNEISEATPHIPTIQSPPISLPPQPSIDFHTLLNAQAEQLEALREKLQQYYTESNQELDYKVSPASQPLPRQLRGFN
jgi:hypothetical protein